MKRMLETYAKNKDILSFWLEPDLLKGKTDSVWYDDVVFKTTISHFKKVYNVSISAVGMIRLEDSKTGEIVYSKGNYNKAILEFLEERKIRNDRDYYKALEKNKINVLNNNWFEISIISENGDVILDDEVLETELEDLHFQNLISIIVAYNIYNLY